MGKYLPELPECLANCLEKGTQLCKYIKSLTCSHSSGSSRVVRVTALKDHHGKWGRKKKISAVPLCLANFTSSSTTASSRLTLPSFQQGIGFSMPVCISCAPFFFLIGLEFTLQNLSTLPEPVIKLSSLSWTDSPFKQGMYKNMHFPEVK